MMSAPAVERTITSGNPWSSAVVAARSRTDDVPDVQADEFFVAVELDPHHWAFAEFTYVDRRRGHDVSGEPKRCVAERAAHTRKGRHHADEYPARTWVLGRQPDFGSGMALVPGWTPGWSAPCSAMRSRNVSSAAIGRRVRTGTATSDERDDAAGEFGHGDPTE